jgi:uncharacterized surface protein with fasciclin (FAS1) repeats
MESGNSKSTIAAVIAVLVLIGGGIGIFALSQNDDDTSNDTALVATEDAFDDNVEPAPAEEVPATEPNIVEAAIATPSLSILVQAVTQANLVETLSGAGPFTVLAPDNDAFAAAIEELDTTAEALLAREDLADILTYHVIPANVLSTDLADGQVVVTVNGSELTVSITEEGVFFVDTNNRSAQVTTADVATSNGTVHIINNVLLP